MNAYELADELENYVWMNPNNNRDYCKEVKDMLRKQADRIAELEKQCAKYEELIASWNTPQTKPLSDDEILNLYKETRADNGGIREFVRAIQERHGIK